MRQSDIHRQNELRFETVNLAFDAEWNPEQERGMRSCSAIILESELSLPKAIKKIYTVLAGDSTRIDEGIPDIVISLISNANNFDLTCKSKIENIMSHIATHCNTWFVSSGEASDPLTKIVSEILRSHLIINESVNNTYIFLVSHAAIIANGSFENEIMFDMRDRAFSLLWSKPNVTPPDISVFRAIAAIKLASPPPVLLLGVSNGSNAHKVLISPLETTSKPIHIVFYCGSDFTSLIELETYIQAGVPAIILQDCSELCAILSSSWLLFRSSTFDYDKWMTWLGSELHSVAQNEGIFDIKAINAAQQNIAGIIAAASGDVTLIDFITIDQISEFSDTFLRLCIRCAVDTAENYRVLQIATKLVSTSIIRSTKLSSLLTRQEVANLCEQALLSDSSLPIVAALLDQSAPVQLSPSLLKKMLESTIDQGFFLNVVVGHLLGMDVVPKINTDFISKINKLVEWLSGGFRDFFMEKYFAPSNTDTNEHCAIMALSIWSILLNRNELAKCLASYSTEPMLLSLILAQITKNLAKESHDLVYYETSLERLSKWFSDHATSVLEVGHRKDPRKSYESLCMPLNRINRLTLTELAFQTGDRQFIAHDCCQRWVNRLLYTNLQVITSKGLCKIPQWVKFLISSLLILPIRLWMCQKVDCQKGSSKFGEKARVLWNSNKKSKTRITSRASSISTKSSPQAITDDRSSIRTSVSQSTSNRAVGSTTCNPSEAIIVEDYDEVDNYTDQVDTSKFLTKTSIPIRSFYSVPIVKFWLSLVFRLAHIMLVAYSMVIPGCGSIVIDTMIWIWTFSLLFESIWVYFNRIHGASLQQLQWQLFEIATLSCLLLPILLLKFFSQVRNVDYGVLNSPFAARIFTSLLLLYLCYSTLFHYIPLSKTFGPLMARVKIMITRDFANYLLLISLVMLSSATAVHSILYPDINPSFDKLWRSLSWTWLSLFTTDLSGLKESDACKKSMQSETVDQCRSVGGYANHDCPTQSWAGYFVVIEYFVILKLISWPILFALFAKTAKEVDEEASQIWKYQLYALVDDFRLRPALPPPLTALYFLYSASASFCKSNQTQYSSDHPDVPSSSNRSSTIRFGHFYNATASSNSCATSTDMFWKMKSIEIWKQEQEQPGKIEPNHLHQLREQVKILIASSNFSMATSIESSVSWHQLYNTITYNFESDVHKLSVPDKFISWNVPINDYYPPLYCKPIHDFPEAVQKYVDQCMPQNMAELRKHWRRKQHMNLVDPSKFQDTLLSPSGIPLNPKGRQGIAGRGDHVKYGPNLFCKYVIMHGELGSCLKVLMERDAFPTRWRSEISRRDESLSEILQQLGIADSEISLLSNEGLLDVGEYKSGVTHIERACHSSDSRGTDNAWAETNIWAVYLGVKALECDLQEAYTWQSLQSLSSENADIVDKSLSTLSISEIQEVSSI